MSTSVSLMSLLRSLVLDLEAQTGKNGNTTTNNINNTNNTEKTQNTSLLSSKSRKEAPPSPVVIAIIMTPNKSNAYVSTINGVQPSDELKTELVKLVRSEI
jgi:hypothetical protein